VRACYPNKTQYDIGRVVHKKFQGLFAYDDKQKTWFKFDNHRWYNDGIGLTLRNKLPTEIADIFRRAACVALSEANNEEDASEKEKLDNYARGLSDIVIKLKNTNTQMAVMSQLQMFFKIDDFYANLDNKPNLLGFENGVYDLDTFEFREGRPDDMLTISTGYNYVEEVDEFVKDEIMQFARSISSSDEMMNYMLMTQAINLHGTKKHELVFFYLGKGRNGKGAIMTLYRVSLGKYLQPCPTALFTKVKQSGSQASPDVIKLKGVRVASITEPEETETLQEGFFKKLTGGDMVEARGIYEKQIEFKPQCQPIVEMNKRAGISGTSVGMKERLRILYFPYIFVENPVMPNERKIDRNLKEKFETDIRYRQAYINILISLYKEYHLSKWKLHEPEEVLKEAKGYLDENDAVKNFLFNNYEPCAESVIKGQDLLNAFIRTTGLKKSSTNFYEDVENAGYKVDKKYTKRPFAGQTVVLDIQVRSRIVESNDDAKEDAIEEK